MTQYNAVGKESKILIKLEMYRDIYVGIDAHKRSFAIAFWSKEAGLVELIVMPADARALVGLLVPLRQSIELCLYEAGPTGYGLVRALREGELAAEVVAPGSIPKSQCEDSKTDRIDARTLARLAAAGLLRYVHVPEPRQDAERQLLRHRDKARKEMTRIKNKIKMFLLYNGIEEPEGLTQWSRVALDTLETMSLEEGLRTLLDMLLEQYRFCHKHLAHYMSLVRRLGKKEHHSERLEGLRQIDGVGLLTGMTVLVELHNPQRFERPEQVAKYAGLSPSLHQSGESSRPAGLSATGNRHLRHVLIEAAWRWTARDAHARARYKHLRARTGCAQKAIAAVARKLVIIMWRMLVDGTPYIPGGPPPGQHGARTGPVCASVE